MSESTVATFKKSSEQNVLFFTKEYKFLKQECIPVGCVPPAAVAVLGDLQQAPPLLLWPSGVVAFWCGGLLPPHPPEDHTRRLPSIRRPPKQKAIREGHNRRPQQKAITEGHPPWSRPPQEQTPQEQTPPWKPAARHAGIPPAMHAGIAPPSPPGDLLQCMLG